MMPAPGDQHRENAHTVNPFVPAQPHVSEYTAAEIATLQSRLQKQLGPEYISTRPGNGGGKVHYLAADKVIGLANDVFGFNGWSSEIRNVTVDFVEEHPQTGRINIGLSAVMRVTLKDGTFHEDIGYGHCENTKGKAAAFEKAKKEAATDSMKRALRSFGNVLGNCLYDKDYLGRVTKVKVAPSKWDEEKLHRHPDFAPIKREPPQTQDPAPQRSGNAMPRSASAQSMRSVGSGEFEDDFDGNEFDETDFNHPDEVHVDEPVISNGAQMTAQRAINGPQANAQRQTMTRTNSVPQTRPPNMPQQPPMQNAQAPPHAPMAAAQPPNRMLPPQTPGNQPRPQQPQVSNVQGQANGDGVRSNSSSGSTVGSPAAQAQQRQSNGQAHVLDQAPAQPPPGAPVGFVSGRAADGTRPGAPAAFNPHAESPSIRRTNGIDPRVSAPIKRTQLGNQTSAISPAPLPNAANSFQTGAAPPPHGLPRVGASNYVNPQADMNRRIGMPQQGRPGFQGANNYRPPTAVKRPAMTDVTNTHMNQMDGAGDPKKPKIEGVATMTARGEAGVADQAPVA
ncbi:uncharacterized protein MYCFIDRAFT_214493 [Pseudocercospora fijiensis CIRAD86]|uniref:RAD52 homolog n=1 Tax=Pseudocercospora fijiensis (strain CIRAD86) TaxID=383855 RepID=M3B320_PSEFD|nr:uncharacterized protein MYCFIDRAFT_214493 [Pseudocercospora fijiensis CIRAD86]EME83757.1 hypothetical protein MYCFIDRAFT_214493 [Pseudocercospora fijiensis CIRAD86]